MNKRGQCRHADAAPVYGIRLCESRLKQGMCPIHGQGSESGKCQHKIKYQHNGYTECVDCGSIEMQGTLTVKGSDMVDKAYLVMFNDADGMILGLRVTDEKKLAVELGDGDARELLARFHAVLDETVTNLYEALEPKP